jgi:S1-C subfamily serine protease
MALLRSARRGALSLALLAVCATPALADHWQLLGVKEDTGDKVYFDLDSTRVLSGIRVISLMTIYPEPRVNVHGVLLDRHMQVTAVDCAQQGFVGLRTIGFLQNKSVGSSEETTGWREKLAQSPHFAKTALDQQTLRMACSTDPAPTRIASAETPWAAASSARPTPSVPAPKSNASTGSGIYVNAEGFILTAAHVVNGCSMIGVKSGGMSFIKAEAEAVDSKNDLALIRAKPGLGEPARFRTSAHPIQLGEDVGVIGYPLAGLLSNEPKATFGEVSSVAGINNDYTLLQISAPIQPGNSGGPVFDGDGAVVGVVVSEISPTLMARIGILPQNVNFAIRSEIAQIFMSAHGVAFLPQTRAVRLEHQDLAAQGRRSTAQIVCLKAAAAPVQRTAQAE